MWSDFKRKNQYVVFATANPVELGVGNRLNGDQVNFKANWTAIGITFGIVSESCIGSNAGRVIPGVNTPRRFLRLILPEHYCERFIATISTIYNKPLEWAAGPPTDDPDSEYNGIVFGTKSRSAQRDDGTRFIN